MDNGPIYKQTEANDRRFAMNGRSVAVAVLAGADAVAVITARHAPTLVVRRAQTPHAWLAAAGLDRLLLTCALALLWAVACWLGLGLLAVAAGHVPGAAGAAARAVSRMILPRLLLRVVAGSAGLGIVLAPALAQAATPGATSTAATPRHPVATAVAPNPHETPPPAWPSSPGAVAGPRWPSTPAKAPAPAGTCTDPVRVHAGDSLWLLAAHRLGPHADPGATAAEWPDWYAANRQRIGPDPALIRPGQLLTPPDSACASAPGPTP
jgi:nucleoid-associated protein YgaU